MSRSSLIVIARFVCLLVLAAAAGCLGMAILYETMCAVSAGDRPPPGNGRQERLATPRITAADTSIGGLVRTKGPEPLQGTACFSRAPGGQGHEDDRPEDGVSGRATTVESPGPKAEVTATDWLPAGHATIIIHGVNDDGKDWSLRIKNALGETRPENRRQEVYLLRWTRPDGGIPSLAHARNSLAGLDARYPDGPEVEASYQVEEARRLTNFLAGARTLYREYGVDGRLDVVAHSQGTLITLKALELGSEADNVVFLGSPLRYTDDRQEDVIGALPHVRGVLYNYYTRSDAAIRLMGGGLWLRKPCGWPEKSLPPGKVVQSCLDVPGHTGYYAADVIRANYADKIGLRPGEQNRLPVGKAKEFMGRWEALVKAATLIDPE